MTDIDAMLGQVDGENVTVNVPETGWFQGRTLYGGLGMALGVGAIRKSFDISAPLRTVQVSFLGPMPTSFTFKSRLLRQGKNVTFAETEGQTDGNPGLRVIATFGTHRDSKLSIPQAPMPDVNPPEQGFLIPDLPMGPDFLRQLELRWMEGPPPFTGGDTADNCVWVRFKDNSRWQGETPFLTLADALPPPASSMISGFAPLSSITWMLNIVTEDISTADGWYLIRVAADICENGYESHMMYIWNRDGKLIATGMQNAAIFA